MGDMSVIAFFGWGRPKLPFHLLKIHPIQFFLVKMLTLMQRNFTWISTCYRFIKIFKRKINVNKPNQRRPRLDDFSFIQNESACVLEFSVFFISFFCWFDFFVFFSEFVLFLSCKLFISICWMAPMPTEPWLRLSSWAYLMNKTIFNRDKALTRVRHTNWARAYIDFVRPN